MTNPVEGNGVAIKTFKRRRLDNLSFSSPGPAFMGTPSSSDAGDDDSDQGIRRRPTRLQHIDKSRTVTPLALSSDTYFPHSSTLNNSSSEVVSKPLPQSDPVQQTSLFRNFSTPASIFRNFDSNDTPLENGKNHKNRKDSISRRSTDNKGRRFDLIGKKEKVTNDQVSHSKSNGSKSHTSNGESSRLKAHTNGKSAQEQIPSPAVRTPGHSKRPSSRTRDYDEGHHTTDAPERSSSHASPSKPSKQSNLTRQEQLLAGKKDELDVVYREHDSLVRELFHLSKVSQSSRFFLLERGAEYC
jgi:hypothetical protein